MNVPQPLQEALTSLLAALCTAATGVVTVGGWYGVQWLRQRMQSDALRSASAIGGAEAYRKMLSSQAAGLDYHTAQDAAVRSGIAAVQQIGSPIASGMDASTLAATVRAGLGEALKADSMVGVQVAAAQNLPAPSDTAPARLPIPVTTAGQTP